MPRILYLTIGRSCKLICNETFTISGFVYLTGECKRFQKIYFESAAFLHVNLFFLIGIFFFVLASLEKSYAGNALSLTLTATNVTCNGFGNGSITSSMAGGSGGIVNYTLTPGAVTNTTGVFTNLFAGAYTVNANDAGIIATASITVTESASPLGSSIISQTNVPCKGSVAGSFTVAGSGGNAGYSYSKDGGTTYQASGTFSALVAGSYTIRVKDANGCIVDQPVTITEPALALSITTSSNSPVCTNSTLILSANGSGGTGTYTYSWTGPNSFVSTNQSPVMISPMAIAAGNYIVTVKDANNCIATNSTSVAVNTAPTVTVNASINTICAGGSVTLTSSSNIPSAPSLPAPILTASNTSSGGTKIKADWTVQPDGYVEPRDGLTFHSNDNSSFYLSDSRDQNGIKTITELKSQSYNTVGYSSLSLDFWQYFEFNNSSNESARVQVSTDGATWTTVASYTSTVGTSNGFVHENINLNTYVNKPVFYIKFYYYSDARARYWAINNVTISGTLTASVPMISWNSNPAGFSSSAANPPNVNPIVTTTYSVVYTNPSTGCSNSASVTVTVNPKPNVTIQPNYCAVPGKVRLTANGGTTYTWTTGETKNPIFTDIADTYGVSSTNSFGCTGSAFLPVSNELVTNGDFSAGNAGITGAYSYVSTGYTGVPTSGLWPEGHYAIGTDPTFYHTNFWGRDHTTNSGNFMIVNGSGSNPPVVVWQQTVSILPNTKYYFSAWAISLNSVPPYANLQFNVNGSLVGTTAPLAARAANNNPPYNWQRFYGTWNSGAATTAIIKIVDLQTALGGNDFGLDDVSFGTLSPIPFTIAPTVNPTAIACSGKTIYLKANITGGKEPVTYNWTGPNGFTSSLKDPVIPNVSVTNSGLYTLTVVDGYGCDPVIATTTATILPSPVPLITSISGSGNVCPSSLEKYWTPPQSNVTNSWSVTGGSIVGSSAKDSVDIRWSVSGSGLITLTSTNIVNLCDSSVTKTILIQDLIPPLISCPATLNLSGCDETALTGNPYSTTEATILLAQLTLAGGSASDNCALASLTYQDVKSGTNPVVVIRTYNATDFAGNKSSCTQIINIKDNDQPSLSVPASFGFCVEDLISASIVSNLLQINPTPDYFLFKKGSNALDVNPATFSDNCTPANQLVLHWKIDFSGVAPPPSISGTGQPSAYASDIIFPGDGVSFQNVIHSITYWVVDLTGKESVHKIVTITILPRPVVSYNTQNNFLDANKTNSKTLRYEKKFETKSLD